MIEVADIQELYRYNEWANDRAFEAASGLTLEQFTRDLGNSHRSVRDTLTHIVWAERVWLQRWKGTSPQHRLDAAEFPDVNALDTAWKELKNEQRAFIESVTDERLGAVVEYVNLQGQTWRYRLTSRWAGYQAVRQQKCWRRCRKCSPNSHGRSIDPFPAVLA